MRRFALFAVVVMALLGWSGRGAQAEPLLVFEPSSQTVLYALDIDRKWHPASLTKLMTAYLVFDAIRKGRLTPESKIVMSPEAHAMPPSKIGLPVGSEISLDLGLRALIIKSANDVAVMLAEAVSGSTEAFVAEMNATARRLGMTRTEFVNPNGLPADRQITTARDMARLAMAVRQTFPAYNHLWGTPHMRFGKRVLRSYNSLLRSFEGANGMKTGFICDSGFNIVASAERDGRTLIAIVMGATTSQARAIRAASLLEHGFQTHGWKLFFQAPTLASLPLSPSPPDAPSIRESIPMTSCNPRLARRVRQRRRSQFRKMRKLRKVHRKSVRRAGAATARKSRPPPPPTVRPRATSGG